MTDREQTRRDAQKWLDTQTERSEGKRITRDLLAELEQAERERDEAKEARETKDAEVLKFMEAAAVEYVRAQKAEARLAKVPALVEALRDTEGSLLAYWTDISQEEIERLLPKLRAALAAQEQVGAEVTPGPVPRSDDHSLPSELSDVGGKTDTEVTT